MAVTAFNLGGRSSKIYLGNVIWNSNSTFADDLTVNLLVPKGAIGIICKCSTSMYGCWFDAPTVGTVLISERRTGSCSGESMLVLLFTEALKGESHIRFHYGSGSGCIYTTYPIMIK